MQWLGPQKPAALQYLTCCVVIATHQGNVFVTASLTSTRPASSATPRTKKFEELVHIIVSGGEASGVRYRKPTAAKETTHQVTLIFRSSTLPSGTAYEILKQGVPSRSLTALSEYMGIGKSDLAELVDLDRTTAHRKVASDKPLPMHAAESVLRLLELNQLAEDTFETPEGAAAWLRREHPMLGGETPLSCAKSAYGAERVKEILIALKYGGAV